MIALILFVTHLRVLTCRALSLTANSGSGSNVTDANEDDTTQIFKGRDARERSYFHLITRIEKLILLKIK